MTPRSGETVSATRGLGLPLRGLGLQTFPAPDILHGSQMGTRFETKVDPLGPLINKFKTKSIRMVLPLVTENPYAKLELKHFSRYGEI